MKRAVVIYLENWPHLMLQLGCLYTSLRRLQCADTELVVFGSRQALDRLPNDCVKVEFPAIEKPPELARYRYINSIACLGSTEAAILDKYDRILRTDADVFLTPAWKNYYPWQYTVGRGLYVNSEDVKTKIRKIARKLGLRHQGIHNTGSTHYGPPELVRAVCRLAFKVNKYLLTVEFKNNPGEWPGWFSGVSILYSCEMAVNHLISEPSLDYVNLDYDSTSSESINAHAHIHCWHVETLFSKFKFEHGHYDQLSTEDLNLDEIRNYCLDIALQSKKELPWLTGKG